MSRIVLSPDDPLGPGEYRLYLRGGSPLAGPGGADRMIDDFTVGSTAPALGTAIDLGSPVSAAATASGSLDLSDDPGAADLYRVDLPAGHFLEARRFEVDAQRIGSPLLSTITVYDAHGRPVPTPVDWLPDDANDPYVFVGLSPGVYYLGVSGRTDLPAGVAPSGGAFRLQAVADPADSPTAVVSSTLNYADPTAGDIPTGLTLRFNGPLDESAQQATPRTRSGSSTPRRARGRPTQSPTTRRRPPPRSCSSRRCRRGGTPSSSRGRGASST